MRRLGESKKEIAPRRRLAAPHLKIEDDARNHETSGRNKLRHNPLPDGFVSAPAFPRGHTRQPTFTATSATEQLCLTLPVNVRLLLSFTGFSVRPERSRIALARWPLSGYRLLQPRMS